LLCFLCAILSKSVTATLPATLLVLVWWRRGSIDVRRDAWSLAPFFAVGATAGLFTGWVERVHVGAAGPDFALSFLQRLLLAAHIPWFYAAKVFWPADLIFIYPRWTISIRDPHAWLWLVATSGILALVMAEARKQSGRRGLAAACIVYFVTLFPVLGFFNVFAFIFSFVSDHWAYLAELAIIVPACAATAAIAKVSARAGIGLAAAGATALVLLGALTWCQCRIYADNQTLFETTVARNPGCWMAHNNLGFEWSRMPGRRAEAIAEFEETLRLRPEFAEAHNNLGQLLADDPASRGAAAAQFRAAIALKPKLPEAHFYLANLLATSPSDADAAISEYTAALRWNNLQVPDAAQAHNDLAFLLCQTGRAPEALAHFEEAIRIEPGYAIARFNLAELLAQTPGHESDASNQFEAFLRLSPGDAAARNDFGVVLTRLGRMPEAVAQFEAAVRLDPKSTAYSRNLALARASAQTR
jgi:tetratricopeptide (TPR) repeat protein